MQVGYRAVSILCLAMAPAHIATGQPREFLSTEDYLSLSGVWKGSMSVLQRGKCSMDRSGRSDSQVSFRISAESNGALLVRPESSLSVTNSGTLDVGSDRADSNRAASQKPWRGHVAPDRSVRLEAPERAVCARVPREFTVKYSGAFAEKRGRRTLALSAPYELCPSMGCAFEIVLDLKQRDDAREKR
jgi:hypothetical protein